MNNILQTYVKLSQKITVYIPSTYKIDKAIDIKPYIISCESLLADCFGGSTSTEAIGSWRSLSGKIISERVTMVFAYCKSEQLDLHLAKILEFCIVMKEQLKQEAISLEVNGELYFI